MYQWAFANLTPDELVAAGNGGTPEDQQLLDSMPLVLKHSLLFPYTGGLNFVLALQGQGGGGWDSVNAAWDKPPVSTEQIMHPEKYLASEQPVAIAMPDVAATLGLGWSTAATETEGELGTGIWLADGQDSAVGPLGPEPLPNANAAAGWGGDRLVSLQGPNDTWAVVWQTAWDTDTDRVEFATTADTVMQDLAGSHAVISASVAGDLTSSELVLVTSDAATLTSVEQALGVTGTP
jgi:hypothetical protein